MFEYIILKWGIKNNGVFNLLTTVIVFINLIICIGTVPSERQTQELMLLEALGRRNPLGTSDAQGIIDMLGRST